MKVVIKLLYSGVNITKLIKESPKTYTVERIDDLPWYINSYQRIVRKDKDVFIATLSPDILKLVDKIEKLGNKQHK